MMSQMSTLGTGEVIRDVNTARRVVNLFRFEMFHEINSYGLLQNL